MILYNHIHVLFLYIITHCVLKKNVNRKKRWPFYLTVNVCVNVICVCMKKKVTIIIIVTAVKRKVLCCENRCHRDVKWFAPPLVKGHDLNIIIILILHGTVNHRLYIK